MKVVYRWAVLLAMSSIVQSAGLSAYAATQLNTESLNQKIKAAGAGWFAKDTPISRLSNDEAKRMMGLARPTEPDVEFVDVTGYTRANLPTVLDWRSQGGVNWVSPILNQANCGSCVAFASIGVLETMVNISSGFPNAHVKLSPQNLFSCGGGYCDYGWFPSAAARYLQTKGVPDEACMPYISGATGEDIKCSASCSDTASRSIRIANYNSPTRSLRNVESVKAALQKGPVVTTLSVYQDFLAYGGGVYKHVTGDMVGGHAISIVGYDDVNRAWIIRNSWGVEWGEQGFGMVSYDDVSGVSDQTWAFQMPSISGAVSIASPVDYSFVTGELPLQVKSTYAGTEKIMVSIQGSSSTASVTCTSSCDQIVDVSKLADGKYEVSALALDKAGAKLGVSSHHILYVANAKPTLSLSYKGKGVDLGQPLKDRIEFDIATSSSTGVPMSALEFHFRGADGVDHKRTAQIVMNAMSMGWRTNVVPNGRYEIWMVGRLTTNGMDAVVETPHQTVTTQN